MHFSNLKFLILNVFSEDILKSPDALAAILEPHKKKEQDAVTLGACYFTEQTVSTQRIHPLDSAETVKVAVVAVDCRGVFSRV
jgi:hypothetical protein